MQKLKAVERIRKRSEQLKAERAEQITAIDRDIEQAEQEAQQIRAQQEDAKARRDQVTFLDTAEDLQRLTAKAETCRAWKESLQNTPLIDTEEYRALSAEAEEEIKERCSEIREKLIKEAESLYRIGSELLEAIQETDTALQELQTGLYLDQDRNRYGSAGILLPADEKRSPAECWRVAEWARLMALSYQYKEYTGKPIE